MGVNEERKALESILKSRHKAQSWLILGLKSLKRKDIEQAIKQKLNPANILFNHFSPYTYNPVLRPIVKLILQCYWEDLENVLTNVANVYNVLIENRPDIKQLLDTPEGRRWLNYAVACSYKSIYEYTWVN